MRLVSTCLSRPGVALAAVTLASLAVPLLPGQSASAADSVFQAQYASLTPGAGQVFNDPTASAGRGLLVWSNGAAESTVATGAFNTIVVRAKGEQCLGAPIMAVAVDGKPVGTTAVPSSAWADYPVAGNWPAGTHRVTVGFTNDYRTSTCDRNLRLDKGTLAATPVPAQQEAESAALTPGAGQTFPDPTASAGRGLLMWSNGTATSLLNAPAGGTLTIRAKGEQCKGAPQLQVAIDGTLRPITSIAGTAWADYPIRGAWAGGTHKVTLAFTNDYRDSGCDRNLRLDLLRVTPTVSTPPAPSTTGNPFAGAVGYLDPDSNARTAADARRSFDPGGAAALDKIAAGSSADWYGDWVPTSALAAAVSSRVSTETSAGALPVLVAYAIPHRDCGSYSAGGEPTAAAYQQWITQLASGIGTRKVVVVVEPDALPQLDCLSAGDQSERLSLLSGAVTTLAAHSATTVYLDAGGPGWQPANVMAARLTEANIAHARGFSLNVSNYQTNALVNSYGDSLSPLVGGKHFLADTSRNGLGAGNTWCNPTGRALGQRMTSSTGDPLADAYTWIKSPGESDGTCGGGPTAGTFWTDYAIGLGARTTY